MKLQELRNKVLQLLHQTEDEDLLQLMISALDQTKNQRTAGTVEELSDENKYNLATATTSNELAENIEKENQQLHIKKLELIKWIISLNDPHKIKWIMKLP